MAVAKMAILRPLGEILLLGVMLASPLFLSAQNNTPADPPENQSWWQAITFDGYMSFSYTHNTNDPIPPLNQFRVFDFRDDDPELDVAQLVVQHPVSAPGQFGFRINTIAGAAVPQMTASRGMHIAQDFDIPEFYLSYVVPLAKGLRLDAGKFATPFGYEVIGGYDGYNDNFSRGFIFGYGIPFTHTGLKASYSFSGRISAAAFLTNGCDAFTRLNRGATAIAQFSAATSRTTNLAFTFLHGPDKPHNDHDQRSLYELVASWKPWSKQTVAFDGLYADEDHAASNSHDAIWKGIGGYSKYSFTHAFSLAFRGEVFADIGGSRTGTSQTLRGFALTPEYVFAVKASRVSHQLHHFDGKLALRLEVRQDFSDHNTFSRGNGFNDRQFTTAGNLIYLF
jgi:hypothetical protein